MSSATETCDRICCVVRTEAADSLLEREGALERLAVLVERGAAGKGAVALVDGPIGIGRSALLTALTEGCQGLPIEILSASASAQEQTHPFGVARQLAGQILPGNPSALEGVTDSALRVLELDEGADNSEEPAALEGLHRLFVNYSFRAPILIVIDDLQWCDTPSLRWLSYLSCRISSKPIVVIAARTPRRHSHDLVRSFDRSASAVINLQPLSQRSVAVLAEKMLNVKCDSAILHRISVGNPLVTTSLLKFIRANGLSVSDIEAIKWHGKRLLGAIATSAVEALTPDVQFLTASIAVLGSNVEDVLLSELTGMTHGAIVRGLHVLVESGLSKPGPALELTHDVVAEAALEAVGDERREELHRQVAKLLHDRGAPVDHVAAHVVLGEPRGDSWSVMILVQAAQQALYRDAPEIAGPLLARALREPVTSPMDLSAVVDLIGSVEPWLNPWETAELLADGVGRIDLARHPRQLAAAVRAQANALVRCGLRGEAHEVLHRAAGAVLDQDRESALLLTAQRLAVTALNLTNWSPELAELGSLAGATPGERAVMAMDACLRSARGDAHGAHQLAMKVLELVSDEDHEAFGTVEACVNSLIYCDQLDDATKWLRTVPPPQSSPGTSRDVYLYRNWSEIHLRRGELGDARTAAERGAGFLPVNALVDHRALFIPVLVEVYLRQGRIPLAEDVVNAFSAESLDDRLSLTLLLRGRGLLRLAQNRAEEALTDLRQCGRRLIDQGWDSPAVCAWRSDAALAHNLLGEKRQALELAHEEMDICRRSGVGRTLGVALRTVGVLTPGAQGMAYLRESVEVLEQGPAVLEYAHSAVELGQAERTAGATARARERLRNAVILAERCGAVPLVERGKAELRLAGGRPRGSNLVGLGALTGSERRVTILARNGHTNRKISQQLMVTQRTVEIHLSNAYKKLGITGRTEIPADLE